MNKFPQEFESKLREMPPTDYANELRNIVHLYEPEAILKLFPIIVDRFSSDIPKLEYVDDKRKTFDTAHEIGELTRHAIWQLAGPDGLKIPKELLAKLYESVHSDSRWIRFHATQYAVNLARLDNRNKGADHLNLSHRFVEDVVTEISTIETEDDYEQASWLVDECWAEWPGELENIMANGIRKAVTPPQIVYSFGLIANRIGFEDARKYLKKVADTDTGLADKLRQLEEIMGVGKSYDDLRSLYDDIKFEQYKPNEELNAFETDLLASKLPIEGNILDIACGTGRLLTTLTERGYKKMRGFDFVPRHVEIAQKNAPLAKVDLNSWSETNYESESFDGGYIIGRSATHNMTVEDALSMYREIWRIMKPGAKLIVDYPESTIGGNLELRNRLRQAIERVGIVHAEPGVVIDSPDGQHYFDRMLPLPDQIVAMGMLTGWEVKEIDRREYHGHDSNMNVNVYYEFTKQAEEYSIEQRLQANSQLHQSMPPLTLTFL